MNWKLIFQLSLFGLAMAFATVFIVPSGVEPLLWLPIFLISAYLIGRNAPKMPFLHGLLLGILNSVWITAAHVILFDAYMAHHAREAEMMRTMPMPMPPRMLMACLGPVIGVVSGIIIGLLALVAARMARRGKPGAAAA